MEVRRTIENILVVISTIRLIPHWIIYNVHGKREILSYEVIRWLKCLRKNYGKQFGFLYLMTFYKEYRNLFYKRVGLIKYFLGFFCRQMEYLTVHTEDIGPGLFIQHGWGTGVSAKSVGKDCFIAQQVTLGYSNETDCPIIGDNVEIYTGARIIGKVHIGNNSKVGTNTVVVKDVPENCTVVGVPAYIVKRNGVRVREEL